MPGATSYLLTAEDGDTVIETVVASSPGTVTGLKAATLYRVTIRSISASGQSQASSPKQAKTGRYPDAHAVCVFACDPDQFQQHRRCVVWFVHT